MKYTKKVFKSGNSLVIVLDTSLLNGKKIKSGDWVDIDIKSIAKHQKR